MIVTLITPTGARPEAFELLEKFIQRQTYRGAIQWIVVDDCTPRTVCRMKQTYLRGPEDWEAGVNTQRANMKLALTKVEGDYIMFPEDDDYYAPNYIETMLTFLRYADIVGLGSSRYYHVGVPGWKIMPNVAHASLSQTAIKASLLPLMVNAVNSGELYFDVHMWRTCKEKRIPWMLLNNSSFSVGMKGMKGRTGITRSHIEKDYFYDTNYSKLTEWIGKDVDLYKPFLRPFRSSRVKTGTKEVNI